MGSKLDTTRGNDRTDASDGGTRRQFLDDLLFIAHAAIGAVVVPLWLKKS